MLKTQTRNFNLFISRVSCSDRDVLNVFYFPQQLQVGFQVCVPQVPVWTLCCKYIIGTFFYLHAGSLEPLQSDHWVLSNVSHQDSFHPDCSVWSEDQLSDVFLLFCPFQKDGGQCALKNLQPGKNVSGDFPRLCGSLHPDSQQLRPFFWAQCLGFPLV